MPSLSGEKQTDAAPTPSAGEQGLLYLEGYTLHHLTLEDEQDETIGRLRSVDVVASSDGNAVAYVVAEAGATGDEDFVARPELHVRDLASGGDTVIGPGHAPLWHPEGRRLAYLEPSAVRKCEGEVCEGGSSVVVADLESEQRRTVLAEGTWSLLAWLGDGLLVADQAASETLLVDDRSSSRLEVAPRGLWGASPDGRWIVEVDGDGLRFVPGPTSTGPSPRVDLQGSIPGEGSWSPAADRLGVVLLAPGRGLRATELGLVEPGGGVRRVPRSAGASGPVLWSPGGDSFVYTRAAGPRGLRLEAVLCSAEEALECRPLFSWAQGVALLALTGP